MTNKDNSVEEEIFKILDKNSSIVTDALGQQVIKELSILIDQKIKEARNEPVTICGKTVDEIVVILNALDLERITDIKVTMSNLDKLYKKLVEDMREANQKAINQVFTDKFNQLTTKDKKWDGRTTFWSETMDEVARILKPNGKLICFGWTSMGGSMSRGFVMNRILLVPHGGRKNDTIVTVETKEQL
jgi:hypothetical protein